MDCSPKLSRPLIFGPYGHLPVGWAASIGTTTGGGETQQLFETRARTPTASDSDDDTHHSQKLVDFPPRRAHCAQKKMLSAKKGAAATITLDTLSKLCKHQLVHFFDAKISLSFNFPVCEDQQVINQTQVRLNASGEDAK